MKTIDKKHRTKEQFLAEATDKLRAKVTKKERRAAQLLKHYAGCEKLAIRLGKKASKINGKKISNALLALERLAHRAAEHYCSTQGVFHCILPNHTYKGVMGFDFNVNEDDVERFNDCVRDSLRNILGDIPPGFFVNMDPRGYSLQLDCDEPKAKEIIDSCNLHKNWGGNGILSPEITGD